MTMSRLCFCWMVLTCVSSVIAEVNEPQTKPTTAPAAEVVPIIDLAKGKPSSLRLGFKNISKQSIRYMPAGDGRRPDFLDLRLRDEKGGVFSAVPEGTVFMLESRVRELQTGEIVAFDFLINGGRPLRPGKYVLEAQMDGGPTNFGMTQVWLKQEVLTFVIPHSD
jgi:hypothetical protein